MPHHELMDDLDARLREARPDDTDVPADAFDAELLARVRSTPVNPRRRRPVVLPIAGAVTIAATAAVMYVGGPGGAGGPSSADAITQTLHWLAPPDGTILHIKSVETADGEALTREFWQSADDSALQREVFSGRENYETAGETFYDPATNTIYDGPDGPEDVPLTPEQRAKKTDGASEDAAKAAKLQREGKTPTEEGAKPAGGPSDTQKAKAEEVEAAKDGARKPAEDLPAGDPIVTKVASLLADQRMVVTGRELHDGVEAWVVSLRSGLGDAPWTLWVAAADGKPLELRDPGGNGKGGQVIRWTTYEVLPGDSAAKDQLTLTGAHPDAPVVHDPAQVDAARARLFPDKR
jgi:hypothetical protein